MTKRVPFIVTEHAVYFPTNGMISLVAVTAGGHAVESGLTGNEGTVSAFEAVYILPAFGEAVVQAVGHAMILTAARMRMIALQTPLSSQRSAVPTRP
jgi:hypothetical protein